MIATGIAINTIVEMMPQIRVSLETGLAWIAGASSSGRLYFLNGSTPSHTSQHLGVKNELWIALPK